MLGLGALDVQVELVEEIRVIDIIRPAKIAPREDIEIVDLDAERLDIVGKMRIEVVRTRGKTSNERAVTRVALVRRNGAEAQSAVFGPACVAVDGFEKIVGMKGKRARDIVPASGAQLLDHRGSPDQDVGIPDGRHPEIGVGCHADEAVAVGTDIVDRLHALLFGQ